MSDLVVNPVSWRLNAVVQTMAKQFVLSYRINTPKYVQDHLQFYISHGIVTIDYDPMYDDVFSSRGIGEEFFAFMQWMQYQYRIINKYTPSNHQLFAAMAHNILNTYNYDKEIAQALFIIKVIVIDVPEFERNYGPLLNVRRFIENKMKEDR